MELVHARGESGQLLPLIDMPGGALLLGMGADGGLDLRNRGEVPYREAGEALFLNPHFTFTPAGTVELLRADDGRTCGMCFKDDEHGDFLAEELKERLYADLAARLADAIRADADLRAHVVRECADADVARAEVAMRKSAAAFVAAARAAVQARIRRGDEGCGPADPEGRSPAVFVVAAVPGDATDAQREAVEAAVEALRGGPAARDGASVLGVPVPILTKG